MADVTIAEQILQDAFQQDLSAAALNHVTTFGTDFRLAAIFVNRTGGGGNDSFDIYFDSGQGATYDVLLESITIANDSEMFHLEVNDKSYQADRLWH